MLKAPPEDVRHLSFSRHSLLAFGQDAAAAFIGANVSEGLTSRCVALAGDVDPIPTLDVLAAMLGLLQGFNAHDLRWKYSKAYDHHLRQARAWWKEHLTETLSRAELSELAAQLPSMGPIEPAVHAWATAFDEQWTPSMRTWVEHGALVPGRVAPVGLADAVALKAVHLDLGPDPQNQPGKSETWLRHWTLIPPPSPSMQGIALESMRHSRECGGLLDKLVAQSRVGVGLPSAFDIAPTEPSAVRYGYKLNDTSEPPSFFSVLPPQLQFNHLTQVFDLFEEHAVDLGLLPELCVDAELQAGLALRFEKRPLGARPSVLCAGSHHLTDDDGHRRNRCVTYIGPHNTDESGAPMVTRIEQDKLFPMLDGRRDDKPGHREDIATEHQKLTVHYAGDWSFVSLICKDLIDEGLVGWLCAMRVRLILVPATSPETLRFETEAQRLAQAQALVVVANAPWPKKPIAVAGESVWWGGLRTGVHTSPDILRIPLRKEHVPALPAVGLAPVAGKPFEVVFPRTAEIRAESVHSPDKTGSQ